MFSSLKTLFGCALLVGIFIPCVFAVDASKSLSQVAQDTFSSQDIYAGDAVVGNLYTKQLRLVQQDEALSTNTAIKGIVDYYARQSCSVTAKDIYAVLSDSASSFDIVLQQILPPLTTKDVFASFSDPDASLPTVSNVSSSVSLVTLQRAYARLFACKGISKPVQEDYFALQREISSLYYQFLSSSFLTTSLSQNTYGEDLFRNGNPDDSQFDLLVDIQSVGNLFFTTFQVAPQVLFYQLPQRSSYQAAQQRMANVDISSPVSSFSAPANTYVGPRRTTASSSVSSTKGIGTDGNTSSSAESSSSSAAPSLATSSLADKDIQRFVSATNTQTFASDFDFVLGNQCVSGTVKTPALSDVQGETITSQEYLSGIAYFLDHIFVQDLVDAHLLSGFESRYAGISGLLAAGTSSAPANDYSQQGFIGSPTASCDAECQRLPLDKQFACQANCAKSCIKTCDGLPLDEKILCANDCACFMVSGPLGSAWKNIENMFSIKFCTEPVQAVYFQRGKTVSSLQGIFNELSAILRGLKQSGQTTKFTKSKEFLDGNILSQFVAALDFRIRASFKPLFPQSATSSLLRTRQQDNEKLSQALLGISAADDYNKYIVLADVTKTKAESLPTNSYEQTQSNIQTLGEITDALKATSQDTVSLYQQQKYSFLAEDIFSFLKSQQQFWDYTFMSFIDILGSADTLQQKISNSK